MNRQQCKQAAWREWHSDVEPDLIPLINPSFSRGFDAAWDLLMDRLRPPPTPTKPIPCFHPLRIRP